MIDFYRHENTKAVVPYAEREILNTEGEDIDDLKAEI